MKRLRWAAAAAFIALLGVSVGGCHSAPPQQPPGSPTAINPNGIPNAAQGQGKMPAVLQRDLQGGQRQ